MSYLPLIGKSETPLRRTSWCHELSIIARCHLEKGFGSGPIHNEF